MERIKELRKKFKNIDRKLETSKANSHGVLNKIIINKKKLSKGDLKRLGFVSDMLSIPERGQVTQRSWRNPLSNHHLHDHGKYWVMHKDHNASIPMALKLLNYKLNGTINRKISPTGDKINDDDIAGRLGIFLQGLRHSTLEGGKGVINYITGKDVKKIKLGLTKESGQIVRNLSKARNGTNISPSERQIEAGNYKKGKVKWNDLWIALENPKGSTRSGTDKNGKKWSITMKDDYGYFMGFRSKADGDEVDVFIGPHTNSPNIYIIDQILNGKFDEHKCVIGARNKDEAKEIYLRNYEKGWKGFGSVSEITYAQFKNWVKKGNTKRMAKGQLIKIAFMDIGDLF